MYRFTFCVHMCIFYFLVLSKVTCAQQESLESHDMDRSPRHLGLEITEMRVDRVIDAFLELLTQNV